MITIEFLKEEWKKDAKNDLVQETDRPLKIASLHAKYLEYLTDCRIELRKVEKKLKKLSSTLEGYFNGDIDGPTIGRPPFQLNVTKARIEKLIEADDEYQTWLTEKEIAEEKVLFLKEVIEHIKWMHQNLSNFIQWQKFIAGGG